MNPEHCTCPLCGGRSSTTRNEYLWALERLAAAVVALDDANEDLNVLESSGGPDETEWDDFTDAAHEHGLALAAYRKVAPRSV